MLTLGEVASRLGVPAWRVRELFTKGKLPPAERIGRYRVVPLADLPTIRQALRVDRRRKAVVNA